jgi:hypothetical protein
MTSPRSALAALFLVFAGCTTPPEPVPYVPPAAGAEAQVTVKTEKMFAPNRVTLYLVAPGGGASKQVVGQAQSGEQVRREILSFDARLPAGVPLQLLFEYRYDVGAVLESGCDFPVAVTLAAGGRYLVDFIRDIRSCNPRFYIVGKDGAMTELPPAKR